MIYVSVDTETTGLESESHKILSIGAIIEDTSKKLPYDQIPKFNCAILHRELVGSPFAINMNRDLIGHIAKYQDSSDDEKKEMEASLKMKFHYEEEAVPAFFRWLYINRADLNPPDPNYLANIQYEIIDGVKSPLIGSKTKPITINVAGKNFGTFDKKFLEKLPRWKQLIRTKQRIIDPAILFVDWKNDQTLPNLTECKERAGVKGIVTHDALEDAWDVIQTLRKFY